MYGKEYISKNKRSEPIHLYLENVNMRVHVCSMNFHFRIKRANRIEQKHIARNLQQLCCTKHKKSVRNGWMGGRDGWTCIQLNSAQLNAESTFWIKAFFRDDF